MPGSGLRERPGFPGTPEAGLREKQEQVSSSQINTHKSEQQHTKKYSIYQHDNKQFVLLPCVDPYCHLFTGQPHH